MYEHSKLYTSLFSGRYIFVEIGTRRIMAGSNKSRVNSARETLGSALPSVFVCTSDDFQA